MNLLKTSAALLFLSPLFLWSCIASKTGSASNGEKLNMKIEQKTDVVDFSKLKDQAVPLLASRGGKSRGLIPVAPITAGVLSFATDAIKNLIAKEKSKYTADYKFGLTDLYFYDQLSNESAFDPAGMQFKGFKLIRTFINKEGNVDTALTANFVLDTTNAYEILNNSVFRLRLENLQLNYAKVKLPSTGNKKLNMDIEISFITSYVNPDGVLFDNVKLGTFYFLLRDAPLDHADTGYHKYYTDLQGKLLTGRSFIVPRSFGYHMEDGNPKPGYSQGAYSISVKVKESSKNSFVSTIILENSVPLIEGTRKNAEKMLNTKLPANL